MLIYLLVVAQFRSYLTPLVIMAPIPLTIIGVMPGHALLGAQFTATSMIGMIALAGIIVRNSILLVDFINLQVARGRADFEQAVIDAAAVRAKPIALTARGGDARRRVHPRRPDLDVDRREDALVGELAVEVDLHVAGALELLEDHLVHAEPVSISAVAMMVSEPPSSMLRAAPKKRFGRCSALASTPPVSTLPEAAPRCCRRGQAGDRVEQDHHVALVLDQALGLLDHHLGDLHVARGRLVEGRADDLALHRALHVGHFLGPLVDQQHDQVDLGVVGGDRVAMFCSSTSCRPWAAAHDQAALALADRRDQVDDAGGDVLRSAGCRARA
jgi:hypothetical protein